MNFLESPGLRSGWHRNLLCFFAAVTTFKIASSNFGWFCSPRKPKEKERLVNF